MISPAFPKVVSLHSGRGYGQLDLVFALPNLLLQLLCEILSIATHCDYDFISATGKVIVNVVPLS